MTKYAPLFDLDKLTQISYTSTGKFAIYSRVLLSKDVHLHGTTPVTMNGTNEGWVLSAYSGTSWFERKYHEDKLDDLLDMAGDADWTSFATRVKGAIKSGHIHTHEVSRGHECTVTIDNELATTSKGSSQSARQPVELRVEMTRVSTETKNQNVNELLFGALEFVQKRGCKIGGDVRAMATAGLTDAAAAGEEGAESTGTREYESLKVERDNYKNEVTLLKQQVERLQASVSSMPGGSQFAVGTGKPRTKAGKNAMLNAHLANKKRKGQSLVNPRVRAYVLTCGFLFYCYLWTWHPHDVKRNANQKKLSRPLHTSLAHSVPKPKGTEFDDDDDDDDNEGEDE